MQNAVALPGAGVAWIWPVRRGTCLDVQLWGKGEQGVRFTEMTNYVRDLHVVLGKLGAGSELSKGFKGGCFRSSAHF